MGGQGAGLRPCGSTSPLPQVLDTRPPDASALCLLDVSRTENFPMRSSASRGVGSEPRLQATPAQGAHGTLFSGGGFRRRCEHAEAVTQAPAKDSCGCYWCDARRHFEGEWVGHMGGQSPIGGRGRDVAFVLSHAPLSVSRCRRLDDGGRGKGSCSGRLRC
jgi:hypothetical protein